MFGWMGKIIEVDLSKEKIYKYSLDEKISTDFLGGRGLGANILYDRVNEKINPFNEKNLLIFAAGPLTGTIAPTSGRMSVTSKSPLTGTIFDSNSGGRFGVFLKKCGYDAIIISGRAKEPVYLSLQNDELKINSAEKLWKKDTASTNNLLKKIYGEKSSCLCIGQAGENKVYFASIINDGKRSFGRGGLGAVMGDKLLKAIVVKGDKKIKIKDQDRLRDITYEANKNLKAHPITSKALPEFGTSVLVNLCNEMRIFGTENFQKSYFNGAEKISGESIAEKILTKKDGCYGCIIQCQRVTKTKRQKGHGPEFETVFALGSNLGIGDLETIAESNYLCNLYGLDTISCGLTLSCAMELEQRGILKEGLNFGNKKRLKEYIELIAFRKDIGDKLANGSKRFSEEFKASDFAMQVKGLEFPAYDPRGAQGIGLGYATSNRGACHLRGGYAIGPEILGVPRMINRFSSTGKAGYVVELQNFGAVIDSLVVCRFSTFALSEIFWSRLLFAATGLEFRSEDIMKIGERIFNLERAYNLREGFDANHDILPKRFLNQKIKIGHRYEVVHLKEMLDEYYQFRGWNGKGIPTQKKLKELNLR